jgi:hypothetical protein
MRKLCLLSLLLVLSFGASECEKKGGIQDALDGDAATSGTILGTLSQIKTDADIAGVLDGDDQPSGTETNLTPTLVPGSQATTNGGTARITVSAVDEFNVVYVGVAGLQGHYEIPLGGLTTEVELFLTIDQDYRQASINFAISVSDGANIGPIAEQSFIVVIVGSGDIQVSMTFDTNDDLDLYVTGPDNETVFFDNKNAANGGILDLDANMLCGAPAGNSENITWPQGTAPEGTYQVFVNFYLSCSGDPVNYTVTVTVVGNPPEIFTGSYDPDDDDQGTTKRPITTFVVGEEPPP